MRRAVFALLLLVTSLAYAHPSVSVVIDSRGNVFYSDFKQVWCIAPNGTRTLAVPGVHTHELCLDANNNLYGEHLWYEGDATKQWGHYVWMRSPDGRVSTVIPSRRGFREDYRDFFFVRDAASNMYWAAREQGVIMKRSADGRVSVIARGPFRGIGWMTAAADGTAYFVEGRDLMRVTPRGEVRRLARNLSHRRSLLHFLGDRHLLMGLWTDPRGNVFVADNAGGEVRKVAANGSVTTAARSSRGWAPTGGAVARNGDLWILEYGDDSQVRMRRIARDGRQTEFPVSRY